MLAALLPESGTDIKGRMRSRAELLEASGLAQHPQRFDRLLAGLDSELRIITPTETEGSGVRISVLAGESVARSQHAPAAKTEMRTPDPPVAVFGVPRKKRTSDQRRLMRAAGRHHALRWGSALVGAVLLALTIQQYVSSMRHENDARRANSLVESVLSAPPGGVPYTLKNLEPLRELASPLLQERFQDEATAPTHRLHAAFALTHFGEIDQEFLVESIATAQGDECANIFDRAQAGQGGSSGHAAGACTGRAGCGNPGPLRIDTSATGRPARCAPFVVSRFIGSRLKRRRRTNSKDPMNRRPAFLLW